MSQLSLLGLANLDRALFYAQEALRNPKPALADIFLRDAHLVISLSDWCDKGCYHCVADCTPAGTVMDYESLIKIDPGFLSIFRTVDIGRKGDCFGYDSNGRALCDVISYLHGQGVQEFSIAPAVQSIDTGIADRLAGLVDERHIPIDSMLTYHHYIPRLDPVELATEFNTTLLSLLGFSRSITISLLGDTFPIEGSTMAEEVVETFYSNWDAIFKGITLERVADSTYECNFAGMRRAMKIPPIDTVVHPYGRFAEYLRREGRLEQYERWLSERLPPYVCPDLVRWPAIIIEPDGGLNLCGSFEAIATQGAIVSNIFSRPYAQVTQDLLDVHARELAWLVDSIDGIIAGDVTTCRLENGCYGCGGMELSRK